MCEVILKKGKEESLLRFHPWVFSGAIEKVVLAKDYPYPAPEEGSVVVVKSHEGEVLGYGHWQIGSIAVRMLEINMGMHLTSGAENEDYHSPKVVMNVSERSETFPTIERSKIDLRKLYLNRLEMAFKVRKAAGLLRQDNNTYRLVHGEGDFLPGLIVDIYGNTAVVQAHSVGMHKDRNIIAELLPSIVPNVKNVYYKSETTLPFKAQIPEEEKKEQYLLYSEQSVPSQVAIENGLHFNIDWIEGQKTGFFVDQRDNRALVESYAKGRRVLNMCCYTGGFSVYAMRGGATLVHSVDVSAKAVKLAEENVRLNFPDCTNHQGFADDAFHFLDSLTDPNSGERLRTFNSGERLRTFGDVLHYQNARRRSPLRTFESTYDLIILDPPAFAKHRDAVRNALQGYKRLNAKAIEKIASGGLLFTFSCSQAVDKEQFRLAVFSAAAMTGRKVRILHQLHQPADHPVNIYHPEGEYLKGLVLQVE